MENLAAALLVLQFKVLVKVLDRAEEAKEEEATILCSNTINNVSIQREGSYYKCSLKTTKVSQSTGEPIGEPQVGESVWFIEKPTNPDPKVEGDVVTQYEWSCDLVTISDCYPAIEMATQSFDPKGNGKDPEEDKWKCSSDYCNALWVGVAPFHLATIYPPSLLLIGVCSKEGKPEVLTGLGTYPMRHCYVSYEQECDCRWPPFEF